MGNRKLVAVVALLAVVMLTVSAPASATPRLIGGEAFVVPQLAFLAWVADWAESVAALLSGGFVSQEGAAMGGSG